MHIKDKVKEVAGKILFELTIVSAGILLALAVNSWYQGYQQRLQADNLLKKVEFEINNNLKSLQQVSATFASSIAQTNGYLSTLSAGKSTEFDYELRILDVDFAVWKFSQHRAELDQLPVELLIDISESYRALEKAESLTNELAFSKMEQIAADMDGKEEAVLKKLLIELKQVQFHLNVAQGKMQKSIQVINQYHEA
ncbi:MULTISPECIES: hypothetical protein [Shewanella]|uniref:Uncharacterized protein n=2 Tax=Shewanella TaxID=22 RepID=A0AAJ1BKN0_9GAMM|nr:MULTISPECIES: hypothetical protein [Shewanella]AZQ10345.1 hypothetical protein STH12_01215 [Shewanella khirikhana]MCH4296442.1 hypothetical protein [Shewanella zhuhaiensis]